MGSIRSFWGAGRNAKRVCPRSIEIAVACCALLVIGLVLGPAMAAPPTAPAAAAPIEIVIGDITNAAGERGYFLPEVVSGALQRELAKRTDVRLVSAKDPAQGERWLLTGRITSASSRATPRSASVELTTRVASLSDAKKVHATIQRATASRADGAWVSYRDLMTEAAQSAACESVLAVGGTVTKKGEVYFVGSKGEIVTTISSQDGLLRSAILYILRDDRHIATAKVTESGTGDSKAIVTWVAEGEAIRGGDKVIVAENGPASVFFEDRERAEEHHDTGAALAALVLAAIIIASHNSSN
jgi:hypothetical protein